MAKKLTGEVAGKLLGDVPSENAFYVEGNNRITNLEGLCQVLEEMDEGQFSCYRNNEKNDFYNWIMLVIGDIRLANDLARAKTKQTTLKKVKQRVVTLKKIRGDGDGK